MGLVYVDCTFDKITFLEMQVMTQNEFMYEDQALLFMIGSNMLDSSDCFQCCLKVQCYVLYDYNHLSIN